MDRETRRHSTLQIKLEANFAIFTVLVVALSLSALYFNARTRTRQDVRQRLHDIVSIAAQQIDAGAHSTLTDPDQENGTTYLQIKHTLQQIRDIGSDLYFVYTMRLDAEGQIIFIVDAEENPDDIAHLGDIYDDASDLLMTNIATLESPIVEDEFYTDKWGTWLTGYAPFYQPDGKREGVLGIDINADQVKIYEQQLLWRGLLVFGVTLPLALLFGWLLGRRIAFPLVQLTDTATAMAAGDLEQSIPTVKTNDEIGALAQAFGSLAAQLRSLISGLEQRVDERTRDLERRSRYLEASAEVAHTASSILNADELIQKVVELIREQFGLYYVGLFLVEETNEWAVLQAGIGEAGRDMVTRGHRIRIGEGMVGWSIAKYQARIAQVAEEDAVRLIAEELPMTRSEAALPLRSRGRAIGALTVQSDQPGAFTEDIITVLQTMADQVAVALENARLYQESQIALESERRAYGEFSREAWQRMLARGNQGYRYDQHGLSASQGDRRPAMEQAIKTGNTILADVQQPDKNGTGVDATVPIRIRGHNVGTLNFHKEDGTWTDEDISLLETLAEQLAAALENAWLYEDTQRRAARESVIGKASSRMRETLDIETVLQTAAQELHKALGQVETEIWISAE